MTVELLEPQYSIWLLLNAEQDLELQAEIDLLAAQFEGHRFQPHLTLQGDLALALPDLHDIAAGLAGLVSTQRWDVQGIGSTEHFFRSLYLQIDAGIGFESLTQQCSDRTGTFEGLSPYPHLSLAYGRAQVDTEPLRERLEQRYGAHTLTFDRLALVRSSKLVPIEQWQLLAEYRLEGD